MDEFNKLKTNTWYESIHHDDGEEWVNYFFKLGSVVEYFSIEIGNGEGYNGTVDLIVESKDIFVQDIFESFEFHELKDLDNFHRQMFVYGAFNDHKDIEE